MTEPLRSPLVYVDTNVFIDFFEGAPARVDRLEAFFDLLKNHPGAATTSEFTFGELMGREAPGVAWEAQKTFYLGLLVESSFIQLRAVTFEILEETGNLRKLARTQARQVKLPDAIHLATAHRAGCRYFLTSDRRMFRPASLDVIAPDAEGLSVIEQLLDA